MDQVIITVGWPVSKRKVQLTVRREAQAKIPPSALVVTFWDTRNIEAFGNFLDTNTRVNDGPVLAYADAGYYLAMCQLLDLDGTGELRYDWHMPKKAEVAFSQPS